MEKKIRLDNWKTTLYYFQKDTDIFPPHQTIKDRCFCLEFYLFDSVLPRLINSWKLLHIGVEMDQHSHDS
jgi:hypothetical protein